MPKGCWKVRSIAVHVAVSALLIAGCHHDAKRRAVSADSALPEQAGDLANTSSPDRLTIRLLSVDAATNHVGFTIEVQGPAEAARRFGWAFRSAIRQSPDKWLDVEDDDQQPIVWDVPDPMRRVQYKDPSENAESLPGNRIKYSYQVAGLIKLPLVPGRYRARLRPEAHYQELLEEWHLAPEIKEVVRSQGIVWMHVRHQ